jgi:hypothetical protein
VRAVDAAHACHDGLFQERDVFACVREPIRAETDPGYFGVAELQLRDRSCMRDV